MRQPIRASGISKTATNSLLASSGVNTRDLPQLLNYKSAQVIGNYIVEGDGQIAKRNGSQTDYNGASATIPTLRIPAFEGYDLIAYASTLIARQLSTGTETVIKSDFTSGTVSDGKKYGDYGFVTSKSDGLWRVSREIAYAETTQDLTPPPYTLVLIKYLTGVLFSDDLLGDSFTGVTSGVTGTISSTSSSSQDNAYYYNPVGTLNSSYIYASITGASGQLVNGETLSYTKNGTPTTVQVIQINPFRPGQKVTGGTTGATAVILEDSRVGILPGTGTTGALTLGSISGTFASGESVTSTTFPSGDPPLSQTNFSSTALTTSLVTFAIDSVSEAPKAGIVSVVANRLWLGDLMEDKYSVHYSSADTGVNPVFSDATFNYSWTVASTQNAAGRIAFRMGGQIKSITAAGSTPEGAASPVVVVHQENGWFAPVIQIEVSSSGTSYIKKDSILNFRSDFGGERGALNTPLGLVYANEGGVFALASVGQSSIPYSEQIINLTQGMSDTDIRDIDFTDCDFVYDAKRNYVYCTVKKGGATYHNYMIAINCDNRAISHFTNLHIKRFSVVDNVIYGLASDQLKGFVLFIGSSDDGEDIPTEYKQELTVSGLFSRVSLAEFYVQGFLSEGSTVRIAFDTYSLTGILTENKRIFDWSPQYSLSTSGGYGEEAYGQSVYGGDEDSAAQIECFDGRKININNCQRVIVDITASDALPHTLNWFSILSRDKGNIRRRTLTKIS